MCLWCLCKMNSEDGQVYSVYFNFLVLLSTAVYSQNINNQRIIYKDDIEFVTEFRCLLGHPVV